MSILVTGGTGFIASHVIVQLLEKNNDIIIIDNLHNSSKDMIQKIISIVGSHKSNQIKFIEGDICNSDLLHDIFTNNNINSVLHFAALKSVGESQKLPDLYHKVNVEATINLLKIMKHYKCHNFIYSSSATVYGDSKSPVTEESETGNNLACNYAQNKYDVENYIKTNYDDQYNNFNITILRYFNPIAAHKSGIIGENPNGIPNNIFPYLLKVALYTNTDADTDTSNNNKVYEKLTIFGDDYDTRDGTCIRDYIHVVDLARAHVFVLDNIIHGNDIDSKLKIYNVGTGKNTTVKELVTTFNETLIENGKKPIKYICGKRRDGDLDVSYANVNLIEKEIGFKTEYDIKDMCKDGLNFVKL